MSRYWWLLLLLLIPAHARAASDTRYGSSASGTNWTNPDSLFASDDKRASHDNTSGNTDTCFITGFGFSVPTGATIDSIYLHIQGQGTASQASRRRVVVAVTKDGSTAAGDDQTLDQDQNSDTDNEVTGSTNPLWNASWSVSDVNASTFGVLMRCNTTLAGLLYEDYITLTVYYTEAAGPTTQVIGD